MADLHPSASSASSVMRHVFRSKESTKDVISRYQESVQSLIDSIHQLQRDVRSLKDSQHAEHAYQHGANESIQVTLRELNQLTTTASVRLDLQQMVEDMDEATAGLRDLQFEILQEVRKAQVPEKRVHRRRRVGLIEGVFRGLDQLLLQGFVRVTDKRRGD